jgi:hypothetical protein
LSRTWVGLSASAEDVSGRKAEGTFTLDPLKNAPFQSRPCERPDSRSAADHTRLDTPPPPSAGARGAPCARRQSLSSCSSRRPRARGLLFLALGRAVLGVGEIRADFAGTLTAGGKHPLTYLSPGWIVGAVPWDL